jgi:hypothetical protein
MIRQNLPGLSKVYNEALQKEADKQAIKKTTAKGDQIQRSRKESHIT